MIRVTTIKTDMRFTRSVARYSSSWPVVHGHGRESQPAYTSCLGFTVAVR